MTVIPTAATPAGGSTEWQTPPELYGALNRRYRFDYDAFASIENHKACLFSTVEGTFYRAVLPHNEAEKGCNCDEYWPVEQRDDRDGLTYPWKGQRVFINPPYARGLIEACVRKAYEERRNADIIVALLPACPETQWFQRYVLPVCHLEWLPRRGRYVDPTGAKRVSPPFASVVAIYRADALPGLSEAAG